MEFTEPLKNGAKLPDHPADTTARKIIKYGKVFDAEDKTKLRAGLHRNEIECLMRGEQMGLKHIYAYAILNEHIYHTRPEVVILVETEPIETD